MYKGRKTSGQQMLHTNNYSKLKTVWVSKYDMPKCKVLNFNLTNTHLQ